MSLSPSLIRAVLFDFDGTLTQPGAIDFDAIRQAISCPDDMMVLEFIDTLSDAKKKEARDILTHFKMQAAVRTRPAQGAEEILSFLKKRNIPVGIVTRNIHEGIVRSLENFNHFRADDFAIIVSDSDPILPKPAPDGILWASQTLHVPPDQILMVGDMWFDIVAGEAAGTWTALISDSTSHECHPTYQIKEISQLLPILEKTTPLPMGKIPNDLLGPLLTPLSGTDPSVLIPPGIGQDTAAIQLPSHAVLTVKSDPITFATDRISEYLVIINANDIATSGAIPQWLTTTLLFPPHTSAIMVQQTLQELVETCRLWNISLCGGHTEITDSVTRLVISATLLGTVEPDKLVNKNQMKPGDLLYMTKGAGIEGTALIAREREELLQKKGLSTDDITRAKSYLSMISILPEARIAAEVGVSGMHDITEGGIATALEEFSHAGNCRFHIQMDAIPILPETQRICEAVHISPYGLIGSGSLLISCPPEKASLLEASFAEATISFAHIGTAYESGYGISAYHKTHSIEWPHFDVDEIARFFSTYEE